MLFDKNIPLDEDLRKLLTSFYNYLHIKIYVAPSNFRCPICENDIHYGCIRFSKNTCFYSDEMEKELGKLENKLNTWLKTNDKNYNKVKGLKDKVQIVFENLEAKWISEEDFANKYPFEEMLVLEGAPEYDEDGYEKGLKTIEVKRKVPYEHYEYQVLFRKFKENCYSYANKVEHLISVRLQNITQPRGYNTRWNGANSEDFELAYSMLKSNGFIVDGSLQDFFNIFSNKKISNPIQWKEAGMSHLCHFLKKLVQDPINTYIKDQHYRKKAQDYFFIEGQPISTSSFNGSKKPANTQIIDKAVSLLAQIS